MKKDKVFTDFFFCSCAQIMTCSGSHSVISIAKVPQNEMKKI